MLCLKVQEVPNSIIIIEILVKNFRGLVDSDIDIRDMATQWFWNLFEIPLRPVDRGEIHLNGFITGCI